jgi:protoheme IX farnesyltransferase
MNVETGAEQLGKTQVGFAPTSHASYLLARSWRLANFITLMKPRVMALAVFTAMVGIIAAPGRIDLLSLLQFAIAGAGASSVLNMWYDADIDAVMTRPRAANSRARSPGSRRLSLDSFLWFRGGGFRFGDELHSRALTDCIIPPCIIVPAWLKRATRQNIVISGATGRCRLIGWGAATGEIGLEPLALFPLSSFGRRPISGRGAQSYR